jgi:hypothetical protein
MLVPMRAAIIIVAIWLGASPAGADEGGARLFEDERFVEWDGELPAGWQASVGATRGGAEGPVSKIGRAASRSSASAWARQSRPPCPATGRTDDCR